MFRFKVDSLGAMEKLAAGLAQALRPDRIAQGLEIGLVGGLGAGKTTFVRFLAGALGAREAVASPTFVLQYDYHCRQALSLEHWDLYRLSALPEDLYEPVGPRVMRLIEWADRVRELAVRTDAQIEFEFLAAQAECGGRLVKVIDRGACFETGAMSCMAFEGGSI